MKKALLVTSILVLPLLAFALPPPTGFTALLTDGIIVTDWDDLPGAAKYSVNIVAEWDTDGDGIADWSVDFDFGTSDRTDDALMSDSFLNIPFEDVIVDSDVNDDGYVDTLVGAMARVKGLNPGKGNGRQNNDFYAPFVVFYPAP